MGLEKKRKATTIKQGDTMPSQSKVTTKPLDKKKNISKQNKDSSDEPKIKRSKKNLENNDEGEKKFKMVKGGAKKPGTAPSKPGVKTTGKPGQFKTYTKGVKPAEKPAPVILSNKEAHSKVKSLREERRKKDCSHYDTAVEMKKVWEDLRRNDMPKEKRAQLCDTIMTLVRGKERDFVFAHDTTRIFQTLCKYAPVNIRSEVFEALKDSVLEMAKSKYSAFFVRSLLRRGTREEKDFIIGKLMYNAKRLITHKLAGPITEFAYNEFANAEQRKIFAQQFYGPYFNITTGGEVVPLEKVLQEKPDKKQYILRYMKEALESIVQKEALSYTFVHNLFFEYLTYADEIERQAMAECLQEHIAHIIHTREGAKAGMYCVWYSSAKGRKIIIKHIKPFLDKLLTEEYGHMVLFSIFDAVDDTKLVSKLILNDIGEKLDKLVQDKWGRHVILYLLKPRDPQNVNKQIKDLLSIGDNNPFSKKDTAVRQQELLEQFSPNLLSYAADNLSSFLESSTGKVLLFSILKNSVGDRTHLLNSLISLYNVGYNPKHPLDDKPLHNNVRKMVTADESGEYAKMFIEGVTPVVFKTYARSDQGCYFIACLINAAPAEMKEDFVEQISAHKDVINKSKSNRPQDELLKLLS